MAQEKEIGTITHYFTKIGVAVVKLSGNLKIGDQIHIVGHTTDFEQKVDSMQLEHNQIQTAKKGDSVGLKVQDHVREGDVVYLVTE